jgi:hypothetical protein
MNTMTSSLLKLGIAVLALTAFFGTNAAFAQETVIDPSFEVFRIRCQIDIDNDPITGLEAPKVQIQVKARAELLDLEPVEIWVTKYPLTGGPSSSVVHTEFDLGSATADWDTFPDPLDPVDTIPGDFVVDGDQIQAHARHTALDGSYQQESDLARCDEKISSQFRQQTQKVCKLRDFLREKCKSGDTLPDGTVMP